MRLGSDKDNLTITSGNGIDSLHHTNTQEYGDFTQAFDSILLECQDVNCDKTEKGEQSGTCKSCEEVNGTETKVNRGPESDSGDWNACSVTFNKTADASTGHRERGILSNSTKGKLIVDIFIV